MPHDSIVTLEIGAGDLQGPYPRDAAKPLILSVLISVYAREKPTCLRQCLESLAAQTRTAEEVVIVEDGPIAEELASVIDEFRARLPIVSIPLKENMGLGNALRIGIEVCRGIYVARMDSDDICVPDRFEKQMAYIESHPGIDVLGTAIAEFDRDVSDAREVRSLPANGSGIRRLAEWRNPINHMTAVFRRSSVIAAGSYRPFLHFEDYHLWARMLMLGCRIQNMEEILVHVRCGRGMYRRRGGGTYLKHEVDFQLFLRGIGMVDMFGCIRNILLRAPIRLAPNFVRSMCYNLFLRKRVNLDRVRD